MVQSKKSAEAKQNEAWATIGWQGINLKAPPGWSLTGFGGDMKSGTLRCDSADPESQTLPIGLEIRWIYSKRTPSVKQLQSRAEALLSSIEKAAKRAKAQINTSVFPDDAVQIPGRGPALCFAWRTDRAASGRIWYCSICKRAMIVQVYGAGGKAFVNQADEILASIRCQGHDADWRTWALYDLVVDIPSDYSLVSQKLMNIYIQLQFRRGQSNDVLTVEQWSLANVQLKGVYLDEWFERKRDAMLNGIETENVEGEVRRHPALWLEGRRGRFTAIVDSIRAASRLKKAAPVFSGVLWECPESNKAYLIQSLSRKPQKALVETISASLRCHEVVEDSE